MFSATPLNRKKKSTKNCQTAILIDNRIISTTLILLFNTRNLSAEAIAVKIQDFKRIPTSYFSYHP